MTPFPVKPRNCAQCGAFFTPRSSTARVCSPRCAIGLGKVKKAAAKVALKARKEAVKTLAKWKAEAQTAVNSYVRERDRDLPCISCGRIHQGQWHAGHFRSRGAAPHLALDLRNLNKQCAPCNLHLHGNAIAYRAGLIERFGIAHVEAVEADDAPRHWSAVELKAIKADFVSRTKQLKKGME